MSLNLFIKKMLPFLAFTAAGCASKMGPRNPAGVNQDVAKAYSDQFFEETGIRIDVVDDPEDPRIRNAMEWFYKNRESEIFENRAFSRILIGSVWSDTNLSEREPSIDIPAAELGDTNKLQAFIKNQMSADHYKSFVVPLLAKKSDLEQKISLKFALHVSDIFQTETELAQTVATLESLDSLGKEEVFAGKAFNSILIASTWTNLTPDSREVHIPRGSSAAQIQRFLNKQISNTRMMELEKKMSAAKDLAGLLRKTTGLSIGWVTNEPVDADLTLITLRSLTEAENGGLMESLKHQDKIKSISVGSVWGSFSSQVILKRGSSPEEVEEHISKFLGN